MQNEYLTSINKISDTQRTELRNIAEKFFRNLWKIQRIGIKNIRRIWRISKRWLFLDMKINYNLLKNMKNTQNFTVSLDIREAENFVAHS